jgi:hypothetical protein
MKHITSTNVDAFTEACKKMSAMPGKHVMVFVNTYCVKFKVVDVSGSWRTCFFGTDDFLLDHQYPVKLLVDKCHFKTLSKLQNIYILGSVNINVDAENKLLQFVIQDGDNVAENMKIGKMAITINAT